MKKYEIQVIVKMWRENMIKSWTQDVKSYEVSAFSRICHLKSSTFDSHCIYKIRVLGYYWFAIYLLIM